MTVLSWNIHRCIGTDGRYQPERIAEALKSLRADVVALQEIDSSLRTGTGLDQLSYLALAVGMEPVMGPTLRRDYGAYGNAILCRHEILSCEEHDLSYRRFEPRGALAIEIQHPVSRVRAVNVHLGLKKWERSFQIDRLLGGLVWGRAPVTVLLGDFNEWLPFSNNDLRLRQVLGESPRLRTFPSPWPRLALDRIFIKGPVANVAYEVVRTPLTRVASDHLPLVARFELI